ncbi:MAG: terminase family protein, partial [Gilliamella sp.]|nr:terminase family protein [Gilliamella sp.]
MVNVNLLDHLISDNTDPRKAARSLYWAGYRISRISELLNQNINTIHSWKRRDRWDESTVLDRVNGVLEAQLIHLVIKPNKEGKDFKEIDLLSRQLERTARIKKYQNGGNEVDLNPNIANRNAKPKQKPKTNLLTDEQIEKINELFNDGLYEHQKVWYRAGLQNRIRNINKSRQIGATMFFAQEGAVDAVNTGRNQIFLSASKSQAFQFRQYIIDFFHGIDMDLKGEVIHFPHNDARLYFLGTNSKTAQSYHGNLYLDEYFWINKFLELRKVASGMSSQKRWRQTYFSTPSSINHEAYKFWTGELFNKGRRKEQRINVDISHQALKNGKLCADGQWRQIVTIEDAEKLGFDLFDINQLKLEYSPDEFANLFLCNFIDDSSSVFPLSSLQPCMVDSWDIWDDYKPFAMRPLGERPVWIGYDPSHTGDSAGCVVVSPPLVEGGKFRVIEKHQWTGMDFAT